MDDKRTHVKVLICGGRDFDDKALLWRVMSPLRNKWPWPLKIIVGYDPTKDYPSGADKLAYEYAKSFGLERETYPYHYHLGRKGGSSRNQQMIDEGNPDLVIAFPTENSKGTYDMIRRARKNEIEVVIYGPTKRT